MLVIPVLLASISVTAWAQSPRTADETAIRDRLRSYAEARRGGSGAAQAAFYSEDADSWLPTARHVAQGRAEVAKELDLPPNPNRRFSLRLDRISFIGPDVALVDTEFFGAGPDPNGHAFYVMIKQNGTWFIRSSRIASYSPKAQ